TGVSLEDKTVVFDNSFHSLAIAGDLPAGATVEYTNNSHREAGIYTVRASVYGGDDHEDLLLIATLEITPAAITGATLDSRSFVYDGLPKSLTISGMSPEGTQVSYSNNSRTDAGTQEVTA